MTFLNSISKQSKKYKFPFDHWEYNNALSDETIQEIIKADMQEAGSEDVFRKIKKDFQIASISVEESEIRDQMKKALLRAKEDFK